MFRFFIVLYRKLTKKHMNQDLLNALQALATQFQVEISGSVTPIQTTPPSEPFDVKPQ